jgi:hypothetical protein
MKTLSPILGDLLERIYTNKKLTTREMDFSSRNLWIKVARDHDFVKVNGLGERNQFVYILTEKGIKVVELWIQMKPLLDGKMKKKTDKFVENNN